MRRASPRPRREALPALIVTLALAAWVPIVTLALAACGRGRDPVERAIELTLARELGVPVQAVRCRRAGCTAHLAGGVALPIERRGDRTVAWETPSLLDPRVVAARVEGELAALGVTDTADCGDLLIAPPAPTGIPCRLGGGGTAWASIDGDGAIELEIAVTAAIAAARQTGPGDPALDRRSRALDSDEAQGIAEDSDDRDAGTDDAGTDDATILRGPGG